MDRKTVVSRRPTCYSRTYPAKGSRQERFEMKTCSLFRQTTRRDFLRIGGASLCGVSMTDVLRAATAAKPQAAKAKHLICCWMGGGPPHTDMFDMKPDAPDDI